MVLNSVQQAIIFENSWAAIKCAFVLWSGCELSMLLYGWIFSQNHNSVIEEEQEVQLCGYCMICSGCISAQLCESILALCRCSHYRGSKPANRPCLLEVFQWILVEKTNNAARPEPLIQTMVTHNNDLSNNVPKIHINSWILGAHHIAHPKKQKSSLRDS